GPARMLESQGAFARAFELDSALQDRQHTLTIDTNIYRTGLDLSKPLPARWSFAQLQAFSPAPATGLLAVLLLGFGLAPAAGFGAAPAGGRRGAVGAPAYHHPPTQSQVGPCRDSIRIRASQHAARSGDRCGRYCRGRAGAGRGGHAGADPSRAVGRSQRAQR